MNRPCRFPGCITILNQHNKEKFCYIHQTLMDANDLMCDKKGIYVNHYSEHYTKARREYLTDGAVSKLKNDNIL